MSEPTIVCPNCSKEIKLTESLAAPLIQAVEKEYQEKIAAKEADVTKREEDIRLQLKAVKDAQKTIDDQVAEKLTIEREAIVKEETKKAKRAIAIDLETKDKEVADLQVILTQRDKKLKEAQDAQAALLKKQRELNN